MNEKLKRLKDKVAPIFKSVTISQNFSKASANEAGQAQRALHIAIKRKRKEKGRRREEGRGRGGGCAPRGARRGREE